MDKQPDIWDTTYQRDTIAGLRGVSLLTAINECKPGQRHLVANLDISLHTANESVGVTATLQMSPHQMRTLADLLRTHADRVEQVLIPLLHPEPEIIPFTLYTEPEAA